jgi:hypothetical protein
LTAPNARSGPATSTHRAAVAIEVAAKATMSNPEPTPAPNALGKIASA